VVTGPTARSASRSHQVPSTVRQTPT
jgi:hypothetical protein